MTYNVHGCIGVDGIRSYSRIASVIAEANPDVVALQELDVGRVRSGKAHQARIIADLLKMEFHFHPALRVRDEEYGDAILSKYPMRIIRTGALPPGPRFLTLEPRGAMWVSIMMGTQEWQIINTHLGLGRIERFRQAKALAGADWIGRASEKIPLILCGDLNSRPGSRVHTVLGATFRDVQVVHSGKNKPTFATTWPVICLDYILVNKLIRVDNAEVLTTGTPRYASDHFPLVANLVV